MRACTPHPPLIPTQSSCVFTGDANHAREVSHAELERVRTGYEEERRRRERELRERQQLVQIKHDMHSRMEKREKMRQDIIQREAGNLSETEEKSLKASMSKGSTANLTGAPEVCTVPVCLFRR